MGRLWSIILEYKLFEIAYNMYLSLLNGTLYSRDIHRMYVRLLDICPQI